MKLECLKNINIKVNGKRRVVGEVFISDERTARILIDAKLAKVVNEEVVEVKKRKSSEPKEPIEPVVEEVKNEEVVEIGGELDAISEE